MVYHSCCILSGLHWLDCTTSSECTSVYNVSAAIHHVVYVTYTTWWIAADWSQEVTCRRNVFCHLSAVVCTALFAALARSAVGLFCCWTDRPQSASRRPLGPDASNGRRWKRSYLLTGHILVLRGKCNNALHRTLCLKKRAKLAGCSFD